MVYLKIIKNVEKWVPLLQSSVWLIVVLFYSLLLVTTPTLKVNPQFSHESVYRPVGFNLLDRHFGQLRRLARTSIGSSVA